MQIGSETILIFKKLVNALHNDAYTRVFDNFVFFWFIR